MPYSTRKLFSWITFAYLVLALPVFASRVKDASSSQNGAGTISSCPDSTATPFFAQLDGTLFPPTTCTPNNGDSNDPNPPSPYPNRVVVLTGTGFTVTITPALWENGGVFSTKKTLLQIVFTGQAGMTLQSLVIGSPLNNAQYIYCGDPAIIPYCVSSPLLNPNTSTSVLEPAPIDLSDLTSTHLDFSQFTPGNSLTLSVDGFPSEFQNIDDDPTPLLNSLTPASFSASNFLAVVAGPSGNRLTAGGLLRSRQALNRLVPKTPASAPANDLFANATTISSSPFVQTIDTSGAEPQEILSGAGAGGQSNPQQDPIPQDPNPVNSGLTPCFASWPSGSNRVFRSVWYKFTPTASGNVTISTDGSHYDTGVYVFTGSTTSPTTVACNDDGNNLDNPSHDNLSGFTIQSSDVTFAASSGKTYFIMVSEAPPPVGVDGSGNPLATPLANDATLRFSLTANGVIGPASNPVPYVDNVSPVAATPGSLLSQLTIYGSGFVSGATVNLDGTILTPATITSSKIVVDSVTVPGTAVTAALTVANPNTTPHIGGSNVALFPVSTSSSSINLGRKDLTSGGGYSPVTADFNGDGSLDIVSAGVGGNFVGVLLGNGNGTFQTQHQYPTGAQPVSVIQGDFNGDGKLDLATANQGSGTDGNVSILLGNGDGSFQNHVDYDAGSIPSAIVAGDFNGDGILDLAVANFGSSNVSVLLGNGDGSFQFHTDYDAGSQVVSVATGDFNGDGKLDLALAGGSAVSVLLGNGDGTFQAATTYSGTSLLWVATGDFNGDGKLDLATANGAGDSVSVLIGNGNGTFQAGVPYPIASSAGSLAVADLNADGKLDLVVGSPSSQLPVLFGKGDGTFQSVATYGSGLGNGAVAVGDLNNDGRLDVIPSLSNGMSVLLQVPVASLSKTILTFPTQLVGTTTSQKITLTNTGAVPLVITKVAHTGDFGGSNTCGGSVAPGASCTVTITFKPTVIGTRTGTVTINDNASPTAQTITLTGIGTVVKFVPASINFGSHKVGTKTAARTITLTNTGTTALSITKIADIGPDPKDFSETNNCGTSVAAGGTCTISVTFHPTVTGARSVFVQVFDNGGGSPQKVTLTGTGT